MSLTQYQKEELKMIDVYIKTQYEAYPPEIKVKIDQMKKVMLKRFDKVLIERTETESGQCVICRQFTGDWTIFYRDTKDCLCKRCALSVTILFF